MKSPSKKTQNPSQAAPRHPRRSRAAFTLPEVVAAVVILAIIASGTFVVISRAVTTITDSETRMHAFEIARENMEKILTQKKVTTMLEYGVSEKYPQIEWELAVEDFPNPEDSGTWVRALSTATYIDTEGEEQTVELVNWLTKLSDTQAQALRQKNDFLAQWLAERGYLLVESFDEDTQDRYDRFTGLTKITEREARQLFPELAYIQDDLLYEDQSENDNRLQENESQDQSQNEPHNKSQSEPERNSRQRGRSR